eukprot:NODE_5869_length_548_cov_260.255578.p1 GENE.NODE_5869_length_548_cov_260.255578~~NODE_5869_length_548_cov_260.255578.p1  ORF type:complete len:135 (+),score=18.90 NODE_5869_length_548_cov_260.255578:65-469(+)
MEVSSALSPRRACQFFTAWYGVFGAASFLTPKIVVDSFKWKPEHVNDGVYNMTEWVGMWALFTSALFAGAAQQDTTTQKSFMRGFVFLCPLMAFQSYRTMKLKKPEVNIAGELGNTLFMSCLPLGVSALAGAFK